MANYEKSSELYACVSTKNGGKTWRSKLRNRGPNGQDLHAGTHETEEAAATARDKCDNVDPFQQLATSGVTPCTA